MPFLSGSVSSALLGRISTPVPQGLGDVGRKKVDFKHVPSITSYWVKCKRLLDSGSFEQDFEFSSSEILQTEFSDSLDVFPSLMM